MKSPTHGIPEPEEMKLLRAKLELLPVRLGFAEVTLVPTYNDQYRSVSIACKGGTLGQQQRLVALLADPPARCPRPNYLNAKPLQVFSYETSSNPEINFNKLEDAVNLMKCFEFAARLKTFGTRSQSPATL